MMVLIANLTLFVFVDNFLRFPIRLDVENLSDGLTKMSDGEKAVWLFMVASSFILGTLCGLLIFKAVRKQGWFQLPINMMIFLEEFFIVAGYTCLLLVHMVIVGLNYPMVLLTGPSFCKASLYIVAIGLFIAPYLAAGIALMRLIYIKYPTNFTFLRPQLAAKLLSLGAMLIGITSACLFVQTPRRNRDLTSFCLGHPVEMPRIL